MFMKPYQLERIKKDYPTGPRIELHSMSDPYSPVESGMQGTVDFVDDAGSIHMKCDNGRTLAIIPGEDSFHKIEQTQSEATSKFHSELARVLKADGLQSQAKDGILTVLSDSKTVCRINEAAEAFIRSDEQSSDLGLS